jgi:hypothetical protein
MAIVRVVAVCALLITGGKDVYAQSTILSGVWERVFPADAPRAPSVATRGDGTFETGDMGDGWGWNSPVTITQRADSLVVEYVFFSAYDLQPPVRLAYALDGTESRNTLMIGHASVTQRARVQRRDNGIVIVATWPTPAGVDATPAEIRQTLSLDATGRLVVETSRAAGAGKNDTARTIYRRR